MEAAGNCKLQGVLLLLKLWSNLAAYNAFKIKKNTSNPLSYDTKIAIIEEHYTR